MTADLKEAFHLASVMYIQWESINREQAEWGWIDHDTRKREYWDEPRVEFFGRERPISTICKLACVLDGPLPLHVRALFDHVIDRHGCNPACETYEDAVDILAQMVDVEKDRQQHQPLSEPCQVDRIRDRSFQEGVVHALKCWREVAKAS